MEFNQIAAEFDCRVKDYKPLRAVYIAQTDKGVRIIKEMDRDPEKIWFIHGLKEYLFDRGFENIDRFLLTRKELPFAIVEDKIYVMESFIEGRECSFNNPFDRETAVLTLADLHQKGKGYNPGIGSVERCNYGKWNKDFLKKINFLSEQQCYVKKKHKKSDFDKKFLKDVPFMLEMAWRSYDTLRFSQYNVLCQRAKLDRSICHHDYTYHNMIILPQNTMAVIDFDYSCHELPVYDLAAFIHRIIKRYSYDLGITMNLINKYNTIVPLSKLELHIVLSLFEFPQQFWRVVQRYYEKRRDWSEDEYLSKYDDVVSDKELLLEFTENFRKEIGN